MAFGRSKTAATVEATSKTPIYTVDRIDTPDGCDAVYTGVLHQYFEGPATQEAFDRGMRQFQKYVNEQDVDAVVSFRVEIGVVHLVVPAQRVCFYGTGVKFDQTT